MTTVKTQEVKKEFTMEQVFALWIKKSKGGKDYFEGYGLVGFFNTNKKNPKEPDLRVYHKTTSEGEAFSKPVVSLWCNVTKSGKKYLTGTYEGKRVVGFIAKDKENTKRPYVSVYFSQDKETPTKETPTKEAEATTEVSEDGLPF